MRSYMIYAYATIITEDNWPLAVACLPGGFAMYPMKEVIGSWLVINTPRVKTFKKKGKKSVLVLENVWMTHAEFISRYEIIGGINGFGFVPVMFSNEEN